jgi:hypothetical protein
VADGTGDSDGVLLQSEALGAARCCRSPLAAQKSRGCRCGQKQADRSPGAATPGQRARFGPIGRDGCGGEVVGGHLQHTTAPPPGSMLGPASLDRLRAGLAFASAARRGWTVLAEAEISSPPALAATSAHLGCDRLLLRRCGVRGREMRRRSWLGWPPMGPTWRASTVVQQPPRRQTGTAPASQRRASRARGYSTHAAHPCVRLPLPSVNAARTSTACLQLSLPRPCCHLSLSLWLCADDAPSLLLPAEAPTASVSPPAL